MDRTVTIEANCEYNPIDNTTWGTQKMTFGISDGEPVLLVQWREGDEVHESIISEKDQIAKTINRFRDSRGLHSKGKTSYFGQDAMSHLVGDGTTNNKLPEYNDLFADYNSYNHVKTRVVSAITPDEIAAITSNPVSDYSVVELSTYTDAVEIKTGENTIKIFKGNGLEEIAEVYNSSGDLIGAIDNRDDVATLINGLLNDHIEVENMGSKTDGKNLRETLEKELNNFTRSDRLHEPKFKWDNGELNAL